MWTPRHPWVKHVSLSASHDATPLVGLDGNFPLIAAVLSLVHCYDVHSFFVAIHKTSRVSKVKHWNGPWKERHTNRKIVYVCSIKHVHMHMTCRREWLQESRQKNRDDSPWSLTHQLWYLFAPHSTHGFLRGIATGRMFRTDSMSLGGNCTKQITGVRYCVGCAVENRFWTS